MDKREDYIISTTEPFKTLKLTHELRSFKLKGEHPRLQQKFIDINNGEHEWHDIKLIEG